MKLLGAGLILVGLILGYIILSPWVSFWLLPKRRYHYYYYIDWGSLALPGAILLLALLAVGGGIHLIAARRIPSQED